MVVPRQTVAEPAVAVTVGMALTVIVVEPVEVHPVTVLVPVTV